MKYIQKLGVLALVLAVLVPMVALGATIKTGEEVVVQSGESVRDNMYLAGGSVLVNEVVFGDVLAAGGMVLVSENVSEDVLAAGGSVTVLGSTGGDVRVVGGNVLVAGDITGDLVVAGGSVVLSSDAIVQEDVIVLGGQVSLSGEMRGDVLVIGGVATINGRVEGSVSAKVNEKLTMGSAAVIDGNLAYQARSEEALVMEEGAIVRGATNFEQFKGVGGAEASGSLFALLGAFIVLKVLACLLAALVLTWLFKGFSRGVVSRAVKNPLRMLGYGFVALVVVPVAGVVLFATLLGMPLAFLLFFAYAFVLLLSSVYAGVLFGAWVSKVVRKADAPVVTWKNVIGGVVLLALVRLIPVVGWVIGLAVWLIALGSIADMVRRKMWAERG